MNVSVLKNQPQTPPETVVLELSVEEFAMLESLRYSYLAGHTALRADIDSGFDIAYHALSPGNRFLIQLAREAGSRHGEARIVNSKAVSDALAKERSR